MVSPLAFVNVFLFWSLFSPIYVQDASAATNGLAACAGLMTDYDRCMAKVPAKTLIRVSLRL